MIVGAFQLSPAELSSVHSGLAGPDGAALLNWAATIRPSEAPEQALPLPRARLPGLGSAGTT